MAGPIALARIDGASGTRPRGDAGVRLSYVGSLALLAVAYYGAAKLGLAAGALKGNVTPVWPPTGLAVGALIVFGRRLWPGVTIGALLVNGLSSVPLLAACGMATGNTLEAVIGAYLVCRIARSRPSMSRVVDVLALVAGSALLSTLVSASIGVASLRLGGVLPTSALWGTWRVWWLGDALGALVIAPVLLTWLVPSGVDRVRAPLLGSLAVAATVGGLAVLAFLGGFVRPYVVFPGVMWAALRMRQRGASIATLVISAVAVASTTAGRGPFASASATNDLWILDTFLAVVAVTGMLLAAVVSERDRAALEAETLSKELEEGRLREIRQRTEAAVRESEARFRLAFDTTPIGMAITTADGRFLEVNASICLLIGCSPADLIDRTVAEVVHPDDRPAPLAYLGSVADGGSGAFDAEIRFRRPDGEARWSRVSIAVLERSGGTARRLILQAQDIAARRRAEESLRRTSQQMVEANEALQRSEARFRSLAASAPVGVFQTDPDGGCTYTNDRWQEIMGLGFDAALGHGWSAMIHPDDRADVIASWERAVAAGEEYAGRFRVNLRDGERRWVDARSVALVDAAGCITGFVGTTTDVTPMVEAEAATAAGRDQAIEASRLKSQFLANMSHEIRTPINGVLGMAHLLQDSRLDLNQRRYLGLLTQSAENLLGVINDILDFSKVEAGKLELETIVFDLRATARSVVDLQAHAAGAKGLVLRLDVAEDVSPSVVGDPGRLGQVLANLIANAIKFTDVGWVDVSVVAGVGDCVRFEVADSGIGVDPARGDILEPFAQADASTTRRFGGTGLGLAICRQLTSLMGGTLGYRSDPGRGSTFWFEVPLPHRPPAADEPGPPLAPERSLPRRALAAGGPTFLVAEDNLVNQIVVAAMIEKLGYHVDVVSNGREAVEALMRAEYAVVLMDCQMPEMDGFEATREIRRRQLSPRRTPVIALTASATADDRQRCFDADMDDYISKPMRFADLEAAIGRWVPVAVPIG